MAQMQPILENDIVLYNKKYPDRSHVDKLNYSYLQRIIFQEVSAKNLYESDERIISHIFEHKDIGCRRGREWHLRQYTNAYLTNYGNIIMCNSNIGEYPTIKDKSCTKQVVYNKKLPELYMRRMFRESWDCTHTCKLQGKLNSLIRECELWSSIL